MDLLVCARCEHRFYLPGVIALDGRRCPECGGELTLAVNGMASIPIDARWLDPQSGAEIKVTAVELRHKRNGSGAGGKPARWIVSELSTYFPTRADNGSVHVSVNRGDEKDAALRVAAVLDGIDGEWEQHFYLPTADLEPPPDGDRAEPAPPEYKLHLVRTMNEAAEREGRA